MATTPASTDSPAPEETGTGKGRPTPTRGEKVAARKRPLVPNDRAERRRQERARLNAARDKAREGFANGVERYLPVRDRGPQKKWVRDYVDARTSVGEFLIPVMLVVLVLSFTPIPEFAFVAFLLLWAYFLVIIGDSFLLGRIIKKRLGEKFGESKVERGVRWYAAMRATQMRMMRMPKPQVKRRQFPG